MFGPILIKIGLCSQMSWKSSNCTYGHADKHGEANKGIFATSLRTRQTYMLI
jgi:hypothetical protein